MTKATKLLTALPPPQRHRLMTLAREVSFPEDHRIFEAVVAREPWRAEMLMREHVASIKTSLVGYLSERRRENPGEALFGSLT